MVSLFYKQAALKLASKLAVNFRHLVRGGNFPACWKLADIDLVPEESASRMLETTGRSLLHLSCRRYLRRPWLGSRVVFGR